MTSTKSRFSSTDVRVMVRDLWEVLAGQRISNVYNLNNKTYLFKFAVPGKADKDMLLLESGVRFHTTTFNHDKTETPNVFSRKLRSAIRQKRLEGIRQIGTDRVVDFKFGSGDSVAHVILELYSSGNIVLTDGAYEIVAALRTHEFEDGVNLKVGEVYPLSHTTTLGAAQDSSDLLRKSPAEFLQWATSTEQQYAEQQAKNAASKKGGKIKKMVLRHLLLSKESSVSSLGPEIIDHCLHCAGFKPSAKVTDVLVLPPANPARPEAEHNALVASLESSAARLIEEFVKGTKLLELFDGPSSPGYILMKPAPHRKPDDSSEQAPSGGADMKTEEDQLDYIEFIPYLFEQHKENPLIRSFPSFTLAVDEYFCKIEEQKLCRAAIAAEEAAHKRIEKTISDQEKMLNGLANTQKRLESQAATVEMCNTEVEKVRMVINSALSNRMAWDDITAMVASETAAGNPIASLIKKLDLENDIAVLRLPNSLYVEGDDDDVFSQQYIDVSIDLTQTAFNNASAMYKERMLAKRKEEKAAAASEFVIKKVRDQVMKGLEAQKLKRTLATTRKIHGFEKFNWFMTSDGYLVLSGKDNNQSDILVKKHLRPGDVYVHADLNGAVPCIVRNKHAPTIKLAASISTDSASDSASVELPPPPPAADDASAVSFAYSERPLKYIKPVSPLALQEAGLSVVCRSAAWGAKVVTSAWWVHAECVSKAGPVGEELPPGTFAIFGKKNFLPPTTLEMGFGFLFKVDEDSAARHALERSSRGADNDDETISLISEASDRYGLDMGFANTLDGPSISQTAVMPPPLQPSIRPASGAAATILASMGAAGKNSEKSMPAKGKYAPVVSKGSTTDRPPAEPADSIGIKKKAANKKKNKKYANQDEEDYELAMMALGFGNNNKKAAKAAKNDKKKQKDLSTRQEEAGIGLLKQDWETMLEPLSDEVRDMVNAIVEEKIMNKGDLDVFELNTLASFESHVGCSILTDFKTDIVNKNVTNKSGFLAGIMRRYSKIIKNSGTNSGAAPLVEGKKLVAEVAGAKSHALLAGYDDDDLEEEEFEDDFSSLVTNPTAQDVVLYCMPMCGPYSCFKNFKYKMKLTPGTLKKGKIAKQAQDVFVMFKDCHPGEKKAIEGMNKSELTAAVIGEAKISMPGLQAVQRKQKTAGKSEKKNNSGAGGDLSGKQKGSNQQQGQKKGSAAGKKKK